MKRLVISLALLAPLAAARPASAHVFDLYAEIKGGGGSGLGVAGAQKDNDFFGGASGAMYGAKVGGEVLFTDIWVEHWQFTDLKGVIGTWTQFMAGTDVDFPLGDTPQGKQPTTFAELGFGFGFGIATGQQVMPPLDNAQLSDKGFIGQLYLGVDYRFNKVMSIGLAVPLTYGYMFKSGAANDTSNHYHQLAATPNAYFRLHLGK
jgi:hypothetical protein